MKNSESFITRNLAYESEKVSKSYLIKPYCVDPECISSWNNYSFDGCLPKFVSIIQNNNQALRPREIRSNYNISCKPSAGNRFRRLSPLKIGRNIQNASIDSSIIAALFKNRDKRSCRKLASRAETNKRNSDKVFDNQVVWIGEYGKYRACGQDKGGLDKAFCIGSKKIFGHRRVSDNLLK